MAANYSIIRFVVQLWAGRSDGRWWRCNIYTGCYLSFVPTISKSPDYEPSSCSGRSIPIYSLSLDYNCKYTHISPTSLMSPVSSNSLYGDLLWIYPDTLHTSYLVEYLRVTARWCLPRSTSLPSLLIRILVSYPHPSPTYWRSASYPPVIRLTFSARTALLLGSFSYLL